MRRLALAALALVLAAGAARPAAAGGAASKGTSGGAFLTLTPGARASALGAAFGGVADDVLAAHYNPAGLAALASVEAGAGRESRFEGLNYDYAVLSVPVVSWTERGRRPTEWGVTALSVESLTASGVDRRGLTETDAPTGSFGAADRAFGLSYGRDIGQGLSLGATLKYVDSTLDTAHASAFTADAGALTRRGAWSFGGGVRNAFGKLALGGAPDPLPAVAYGGLGWRPKAGWLVAGEADLPARDALSWGLGVERSAEVAKGLTAAGRLGFRTGRQDAGTLGGISIGFGAEWRGLAADFCWSPGGVLGDVLQYSVRARF